MIDIDDVDGFCSWLAMHEQDVVGRPGMCFQAPLARWLSERSGHVYGVNGDRYGCASSDWCGWRLLPRWAQALVASSERVFPPREVTGSEVFDMLASLERRLLCSGTHG
ncbi:MAG: hypothetical protein WCD86_11045 [Ktedonobacteraceae bacterium]